MNRRLSFVILLALCAVPALFASRIKDLTLIEGGRDNQLVGYGLVVGLAGDGDSNAATTLRTVSNLLQRYGLTINPTDIKAKNVAAVMITADIVAQGPIAIGGFLGGGGGPGGATVQKNHPTVGAISNGAIVEREIPASFVHDNALRLLLHNPDFTSVARMTDAINAEWPATATAIDAATIRVSLPADFRGRNVDFISKLGEIESVPDTVARIVINERTGTIVATATVRLSHVAIAHGSLTITVTSNLNVSQPGAFSQGKTTVTPSTNTSVNETKGGFTVLNEPPTIERLAAALNALGVSTRDMMAIFQTLKRSGALQAELIIN